MTKLLFRQKESLNLGGNWFLARTPELDFISQGRTREEAKKNLLEVARIQFREIKEMGTLEDYLLECGFETKENDIRCKGRMVAQIYRVTWVMPYLWRS